jgi:hypothetical protein
VNKVRTTIAVAVAGLIGCGLALCALGCASPDDSPSIDIRSRDVTWPTYDGELDRPATPFVPEEESETD